MYSFIVLYVILYILLFWYYIFIDETIVFLI